MSDQRTLMDIQSRVLLPDSDPKKIYTFSQMVAEGHGKVSLEDLTRVDKERQRTSEGRAMDVNRNNLINSAKSLLLTKDAMSGFFAANDAQSYNFNNFMKALQDKEAQYEKEGKPLPDLYNAKHKDSFFQDLDSFKMTPEQVIEARAKLVKQREIQKTEPDVATVKDSNGKLFTVPKKNLSKLPAGYTVVK